ncbi:hypothetical protein MMC24_005141 [Lignoscripta atroalba]|nr:hypothetical protein [Lignoscripta atroalba]
MSYAALYQDLPHLASEGRSIRLVVLHSGQPADDLVCSLVLGNLDESRYEALSYTWGECLSTGPSGPDWDSEPEWEDVDDSEAGDDLENEQIPYVEDGSENASADEHSSQSKTKDASVYRPQVPIYMGESSVPVMPNLSDALRHLRCVDSDRTLWIDYLCINQSSVLDRNAQVRRMDEIYHAASQVIIWLGLPDDDSDKGLHEISLMTTNAHLSELYASEQSQSELIQRIKPLVYLLSRAWFQRVWIVQEVALAQHALVQVGTRVFPWSHFVEAARVFRNHMSCCSSIIHPFMGDLRGDFFLELRHYLADILALDMTSQRSLPLLVVLRLFRSRLASDPRDKIFGILGLLQPSERLIVADYRLSTSEIYQQTTAAIINHTGNLSILIDIDEYAGVVADVPTWCPDWTTGSASGVDIYDHYNACLQTTAVTHLCSLNTLSLQGILIDVVTSVIFGNHESSSSSDDNLLEAHRHLLRWEALVGLPATPALAPYTPTGESHSTALWQTTLMGVSASRTRRVRSTDSAAYAAWRHWLDLYAAKPSKKHREAFLAKGMRDRNIRAHNDILVIYPSVRWFFLTSRGYMGLGPVEMESGDVVCVLKGGKMPFVLRELDDEVCEGCEGCGGTERACHRLVGFAYVHGIMDGEAMRLLEQTGGQWRDFCLR